MGFRPNVTELFVFPVSVKPIKEDVVGRRPIGLIKPVMNKEKKAKKRRLLELKEYYFE